MKNPLYGTFLVLQIPRFLGIVDVTKRGVNVPCVMFSTGEFHMSTSQKRMVYLHLFVTYPH